MSRSDMQRCIDECQRCHDVCLQAMTYGLRQSGHYVEPTHIVTLLDCAELCTTTVNVMLRGSARHRRTCELCAEICEACANSCAAVRDDDEMRRCEAECHRCAALCREMARSTEAA
jgi:hypothetical protein